MSQHIWSLSMKFEHLLANYMALKEFIKNSYPSWSEWYPLKWYVPEAFSGPFLLLPPASLPTQCKSFAQALTNACDILANQLPRPCLKGNPTSIKIFEDEYRKGIEACKHNLHCRLLLSKEDNPIKIQDLRAKLANLWRPIAQWKMVLLGKGFYEFSFAST